MSGSSRNEPRNPDAVNDLVWTPSLFGRGPSHGAHPACDAIANASRAKKSAAAWNRRWRVRVLAEHCISTDFRWRVSASSVGVACDIESARKKRSWRSCNDPAALSLLLNLAAASLLSIAPTLARADDFYEGKTVNIIVGFSSGGGFDAYARLLAQFIGAHISGKPNVIVQNMPGAGSLTAVRSLDVTQPKDGTAVVIFNPGISPNRSSSPRRSISIFVRLLARHITPDFRVCYGFGVKGMKSWDDLMGANNSSWDRRRREQAIISMARRCAMSSRPRSSRSWGFPVARNNGSRSNRASSTAIAAPSAASRRIGFASNKAHMFVRFSKTSRPRKSPKAPPYIDDLAKTPTRSSFSTCSTAADEVGRPFVMSNEVPADRIAIMRGPSTTTMKDPELLAAAKKAQLRSTP